MAFDTYVVGLTARRIRRLLAAISVATGLLTVGGLGQDAAQAAADVLPGCCPGVVWDDDLDAAVMYGGQYYPQPFGDPVDSADTWTWADGNWSLQAPTSPPPGWSSPTMAYDRAHRQVVVLGGQTWTWDGSTWTQYFPDHNPPLAGSGKAIVWDPLTQSVIAAACPARLTVAPAP